MKLRGALCTALLACLLAVSCSPSVAKDANVVYYTPELSEELRGTIHPYAFAHKRAVKGTFTAGNDAEAQLDSLLEEGEQDSASRTALRQGSAQAAALKETPVLVEEGEAAGRSKFFNVVNRVSRKVGGALGLQYDGLSDENNPATEKTPPMKENPSFFHAAGVEAKATGSFPGSASFRRAVYGTRRRRMPYSSGELSLNPWRRANSFSRNPQDFLFPRTKGPLYEAVANALAPQDVLNDPMIRQMVGGPPVSPAMHSYGTFAAMMAERRPISGLRGPGGSILTGRGVGGVGGAGAGMAMPPMAGMGAAGAMPAMPDFSAVPQLGSMGVPVGMPNLSAGFNVAGNYDSFRGGPGMRWDGEKYAGARNPLADGPSPYIPGGDYEFNNLYPPSMMHGGHMMGGLGLGEGAAAGVGGMPSVNGVAGV